MYQGGIDLKLLNMDKILNIDVYKIKMFLIVILLVIFSLDLHLIFGPLFVCFMLIELAAVFVDVNRIYYPSTHPIVAINIDGTIISSEYPNFGEPFKYAIETINRMQKHGYNVIIWSTRSSDSIIEAKKLLLNYGLSPDVDFKIPSLDESKDGINLSKVPAFVYLDNNNYRTLDDDYELMWAKIHKDFLGMTPKDYERRMKKYGYVNIDAK